MISKRNIMKEKLIVAGLMICLIIGAVIYFLISNGTTESDTSNETRTETILGYEYITNLDYMVHGNTAYFLIPVNEDTESIVLKGEVEADSEKLGNFISTLDTFIPGEYSVSLENHEVRFIVDGIDEEPSS